MPELPEVETVTKILKPLVINQTINKIDVLRKQTIIGDPNKFVSSLIGETFIDITRIGKYIIFHLTHDKVIISHLRMEGKYYSYNENENNSTYARVVFHFNNNQKLCYDDSRCFGILILSCESEYKKEKEIAKLGPEPFDINDVSFLLEATKNKTLPIKTTLLDQSLMTGLGNIYVDETLFASKIHPLTPAKLITNEEWISIVDNAKRILTDAIKLGGSTIKSYHPGKDIDGKFQNNIKVYGKGNEKCPCCNATLRFIKVRGRGTTFCPKCQLKKGSPMYIGLTGKTGSGKSTVINLFKKNGFQTLSSDEVVASLYKDETVTRKIEQLLKIKFPNKIVDKKVLREHLFTHKEDKRKLERLVHPLVAKEIIKFLKEGKTTIKIVEVPLLFETGLDALFDTIIITDINKEKQYQLVNNRDKEKALMLLELNKNNKIDASIGKAAYILTNDGSITDFENKTISLINKLKDSLN